MERGDWAGASDEELVDGLRADLDDAWRELDRRHGRSYVLWACAGFRRWDDEDLRAYVPGFLFERLHSYRGDGFRGWLRQVVRSASGQLLRDRACKELVIDDEVLDEWAVPESVAPTREAWDEARCLVEGRLARVDNRLYVLIYRLLSFRLAQVRAPNRGDVRAARRWVLERAVREPGRSASWLAIARLLASVEHPRTLRHLLRQRPERAKSEGLGASAVAGLLGVDVQVVWQAKTRVLDAILPAA